MQSIDKAIQILTKFSKRISNSLTFELESRLSSLTKKQKEHTLESTAANSTAANVELKAVYDEYRSSFLEFGRQFKIEREDLLDIFQDAVIAFYEQKERGKLENLTCTEKTYLFNIGKYKSIDFLKKAGRTISFDKIEYEVKIEPQVYQTIELSEQQQELRDGVKLLGKSCQEILDLFYYRKYSISAIMQTLNFKSENVVKANKSRCIKSLKTILIERNTKR